MKQQVVILTKPGDTHAFAVEAALREFSADPVLIHGREFPNQLQLSFSIAPGLTENFSAQSSSSQVTIDPLSVWYRRRSEPVVESFDLLDLQQQDADFAYKECRSGYSGLLGALSLHGQWVNPYQAASMAEHKPLQLSIAKKAGFVIPHTLISNHPADIHRFLSGTQAYIYKPFKVGYWTDSEGRFLRLPTTQVSLDDLPDSSYLKLTPGIYQKKVPKAHEVRATFFGKHCIAVRINSPKESLGSADWRTLNPRELSLSLMDLPVSVHEKCLKVMSDLGIIFGCFDLIVSDDGDYVFLEVNASGQFLWIEAALPEAKLLKAICGLLLSADPFFDGQWDGPDVSFAEILKSESYLTRTKRFRR